MGVLFGTEGAALLYGKETTNRQASGFVCSKTIDEFNLLCIAAFEAKGWLWFTKT
jgi:hypothetical protein